MSSMGLGMVADQLADLKLGELLDTPPPGLDEAVAIAKVCLTLNAAETSHGLHIGPQCAMEGDCGQERCSGLLVVCGVRDYAAGMQDGVCIRNCGTLIGRLK
jgi:hypothetical protein